MYRASSFGKIRNIIKYQRFMTSSDYALLLTVRRVSQDH
ncbi:reverse transcriptase N-terminal domain-containing protein [Trichodesmium erythraeum]|nr:reverse transcriptase N-terminal domain-containing protein [Trichodesmium sp. St11_bin5]MDT9341029.1 reverse transcriptase N-terminal domain-containing protein [Trichodesmium erythraeum 21-75]